MADYKDMLTEKIGKIVNDVKGYTNGKSFREIYEDGASRAGNLGKIAKLMLEVNSDSDELKKVYCEIGKLYYEENKGHGSEFFAPLFERVEELTNAIDVKRCEIEAMKSTVTGSSADSEPDIDVEIVDFDKIVDESGRN